MRLDLNRLRVPAAVSLQCGGQGATAAVAADNMGGEDDSVADRRIAKQRRGHEGMTTTIWRAVVRVRLRPSPQTPWDVRTTA